jgi:hypothetical protein
VPTFIRPKGKINDSKNVHRNVKFVKRKIIIHRSLTPLTTSFFHVDAPWERVATHPLLQVVNADEDDADKHISL